MLKDNTWNRFKQIIYPQFLQTLNLHHLAPSNPKGSRRACLLCASKPLALHRGTPTHSSPVPSANHLWFDTGDGFLKKRWVSPPSRFKFLQKIDCSVGDVVSNASISAECWLNWSIYQYILSHSFFHGQSAQQQFRRVPSTAPMEYINSPITGTENHACSPRGRGQISNLGLNAPTLTQSR